MYWGVGNPGRIGMETFAPAITSIHVLSCSGCRNGKLRWHFQFSPHDTHDWDATHVPMLFDAQIRGAKRRLIGIANRNAFYYVLDRTTVNSLPASLTRRNLATGLDPKGRPILRPCRTSKEGISSGPNANGATVWFSPSTTRKRSCLCGDSRDRARYSNATLLTSRDFFPGGGEDELPADDAGGRSSAAGGVRRVRWEFKLHSPPGRACSRRGGLVFSGSNEGNFYGTRTRARGGLCGTSRPAVRLARIGVL